MGHDVAVIMYKEGLELVSSRSTLLVFLAVGALVGAISPLSNLRAQAALPTIGPQQAVDNYSGTVFLGYALVTAWGLCASIFLQEKVEGTLETLLATPLSLRAIWLGKSVAAFLVSYPYALLCAAVLIARFNAAIPDRTVVLPSNLSMVHLLVSAPMVVFSSIAMNGLLQFAFNNPKVGFYGMLLISFGVVFLGGRVSTGFGLEYTLGYGLVGAGMLALTVLASKVLSLSKERVVLSIS